MPSLHRVNLVVAALAVATAALVALPTAAVAAGSGVGDVSDAMLYDGSTAPLGAVVEELRGTDEATHTIATSWPINVFGTSYGALCISTNGGIVPVASDADGCTDGYNATLAQLAVAGESPFIGVLAGDITLMTRVLDADGDEILDDGFGEPGNVYFADTTIGGVPTIVVTWYRVHMYDDENSRRLSNTFQIVLQQRPTTDGETLGFDFDVQFNFGTMTDGEEGYTVEGCDEDVLGFDCRRWGVGFASYDPVTESSTAYELFPNTIARTLVDSGAAPLVANHLNSPDVLGRYQFSMVAGVTTDFAVPTLLGVVPVPTEPELADTGVDLGLVVPVAAFMLLLGVAAMAASRRRAADQR